MKQISALLLCFVCGIPHFHAQNITSGLIAYYPFSGNMTDQSGIGHGLQVTGAALATDRYGSPSAAIRFSDRFSTASTDVSLAATSFSIGGWFYQDQKDPLAAPGFWQGEVGQAGLAFRLMLDYGNTSARFTFWYNDLDAQFVRDFGKWFHLMGTFDRATLRRKLYINGVIVAQDTALYGFSGTGPLHFGNFSGLMDEVRVYSRALSDADVQQLYAVERPPVPPTAPVITTQPAAQTIIENLGAAFLVIASGTTPVTYQWRKNGVAIAGAIDPSYAIPAVKTTDAGNYSVAVTNAGGTVTSSEAALTIVAANPGRLVNLSTLGSGGFTMGFVVGGGTSKNMLIRVVGPTLKVFGVSTAATQTSLTLYSGATILGVNSGWSSAPNASQMIGAGGAFALTAGSTDSAILTNLAPGSYTAHATGNGSVLVEVYELP